MNQIEQTKNYLADFSIALLRYRSISIKYLLLLMPIAIGFGTISFMGGNNGSELWLKICQLFIFFSTGVLHVYLLTRKVFFYWLRFLGHGIFYTISLSVIICTALLLFYFFTNTTMAIMAIASGASFCLPHIIFQCLNTYTDIPQKEYKKWTSPGYIIDIDEILMIGEVKFWFCISQDHNASAKKILLTVPASRKLGIAFYSAFEKNEDIFFMLNYKNSGWEFYKEKFWGLWKVRLDPERSIYENRVSINSKILVKKIELNNSIEKGYTKLIDYCKN